MRNTFFVLIENSLNFNIFLSAYIKALRFSTKRLKIIIQNFGVFVTLKLFL